jgi:hypothetical protein
MSISGVGKTGLKTGNLISAVGRVFSACVFWNNRSSLILKVGQYKIYTLMRITFLRITNSASMLIMKERAE